MRVREGKGGRRKLEYGILRQVYVQRIEQIRGSWRERQNGETRQESNIRGSGELKRSIETKNIVIGEEK